MSIESGERLVISISFSLPLLPQKGGFGPSGMGLKLLYWQLLFLKMLDSSFEIIQVCYHYVTPKSAPLLPLLPLYLSLDFRLPTFGKSSALRVYPHQDTMAKISPHPSRNT